MRLTVYLPDALGAEVKDKLAEANVSKIVQSALRAELSRPEPEPPAEGEEYYWRFLGFATDIGGRPSVRLYAHREYAACGAVVAEDDRLDHLSWCMGVIRR